MISVIGVSFQEISRIYYFLPNDLKLKKGITVIVETERGLQFGKIATEVIEIEQNKINSELKKVIRIASKKDYYRHRENLNMSNEALKKCRELIEKQNLKMKVLDANFTFDRNQLMFHFLSDNRVDFRALAKDLASVYRTRIELRQVGVRDKAKQIGGLGCCGRELCCHKFLKDLDSVSINMAKNQNISLNPSKINGVCGRLLCCLKYEDSCYKDAKKDLPNLGQIIDTEKGKGRVVSIDILNKSYFVDIEKLGIVEFKK